MIKLSKEVKVALLKALQEGEINPNDPAFRPLAQAFQKANPPIIQVIKPDGTIVNESNNNDP